MRRKAAIVINILLVLAGTAGLAFSLSSSLKVLVFYTIDSNLLAVIGSLVYLAGEAAADRDLWGTRASWPGVWRYVSVCALMVTFLVVMLILLPMNYAQGYGTGSLFTGWNLFFHVIAPILSGVSFCFLEDHEELTPLHAFGAVFLTVVYTGVMIWMNITDRVVGPYPFLMVKNQPVFTSVLWFAAILVLNLIIALGTGAAAVRFSRAARIRANRKRST